MNIRLQKFIARCGIASRRKAEQLIQEGRVRVNGRIATLGMSVDEKQDVVFLDAHQIQSANRYEYIMLHKPRGYVSTKAHFRGQKSVYDLVPKSDSFALAGRLDKDTSGLLLFSNDGELIYQLTHPSFRHIKTYDVLLSRPLAAYEQARLQKGVRLEEGIASCDSITQLGPSRYRMTLHQGWNRQIRRMCETLDVEVRVLQRVGLGRLTLGNLPAGSFRHVTRKEII
ncbi:MAG: pseudouridine synthase [Patescibacteria group bacterium]|jgi:23S rRNA pseudouridine2605 synthase